VHALRSKSEEPFQKKKTHAAPKLNSKYLKRSDTSKLSSSPPKTEPNPRTMKLSIKTLQGNTFPIECAESDTVLAVKEKVKAAQGFEPETQKLIYAGKILKDDQTVSAAGVKENDFLVCMISKVSEEREQAHK
jgi:hypothetical protein